MEIGPIGAPGDRHAIPSPVPRVERVAGAKVAGGRDEAKPQVGDAKPDGMHADGLTVRAHVERDEITDTNIVRYRDRFTGEVLYQLPPKAVLEQIRAFVAKERAQEEGNR
jgi:hypothetical protein